MRVKRLLLPLVALLALSAAPVSPSAAGRSAQDTSKSKPQARAKKTSGKRSRARRQRGQKTPTPDRIQEIQAALAREGAYNGQPSGKWDAASIEAMKRFQAAHGLNPTGKLDALSLQKLGLGSDIAGRAAPRPPAQPQPATSVRQ